MEQPTALPAANKPATIKPLSKSEQNELLNKRLDGRLGDSFGQFANMFLVSSELQLGCGVGLIGLSPEIAAAPLQPSFPQTYQPTLRELLDAIALQTSSQWKYDPSSKHLQSNVEHGGGVVDLAMFEFAKAVRDKPFEVDLADGWRALDKGNWMMYVPPNFVVGLDIYELGRFSAPDDSGERALVTKLRRDVALEWAARIKADIKPEDLQTAKVGDFDALFSEATIAGQAIRQIRWRQWVFMVADKCYFVISTLPSELDKQLFPDVEAMLASFRIKRQ